MSDVTRAKEQTNVKVVHLIKVVFKTLGCDLSGAARSNVQSARYQIGFRIDTKSTRSFRCVEMTSEGGNEYKAPSPNKKQSRRYVAQTPVGVLLILSRRGGLLAGAAACDIFSTFPLGTSHIFEERRLP